MTTYYKMQQRLLQNATVVLQKMAQRFITKCVRFFLKNATVLQKNATVLLQNAAAITKCVGAFTNYQP